MMCINILMMIVIIYVHVVWCITVSGLRDLQVGNLPKRVRSCRNFNKSRVQRHRCIFSFGRSHTRIWGVIKLVSEHGLEVDDCTRIHLEADPLSVTDVIME